MAFGRSARDVASALKLLLCWQGSKGSLCSLVRFWRIHSFLTTLQTTLQHIQVLDATVVWSSRIVELREQCRLQAVLEPSPKERGKGRPATCERVASLYAVCSVTLYIKRHWDSRLNSSTYVCNSFFLPKSVSCGYNCRTKFFPSFRWGIYHYQTVTVARKFP
jgi:hypothetical protein